jgi:hypothetical protein
MNRAVLSVAILALAVAAPAGAAVPVPIPLRYDRQASSLALSGPDVLVMNDAFTGPLRVLAVPRTGGTARTLLRVPGAEGDSGQLVASAQRVAVAVDVKDEHRVYTGRPSGPLHLVLRTRDPDQSAWTPEVMDVDGDRLLLNEYVPEISSDDDEGGGQLRASILDASGRTPIPWASGKRVPVAIAGPYAATVAYDPKRIEVVDLASGTPLYAVNGEFFTASLDLLPDGRVTAGLKGGIALAGLGQPQTIVANSGRLEGPRFAGPSIAALDDARRTLDLVGPDGTQTPLGPPSFAQAGSASDADGVAWAFNGCVRYAALTAAAAPKSAHDPCPQTEISLSIVGAHSKLHGNHARVPFTCVAAAGGRCRGEFLLREGRHKPVLGRGRFSARPSLHDAYATIHFTRAAVAKFKREHGGFLTVYPRVHDGTAGTDTDGDDFEFDVEV